MSEVAELKRRIELEYEAIQRAMTGLAAGTARHEYIMARLNNVGQYKEELSQHIGVGAAMKLVYELYEQAMGEETRVTQAVSKKDEAD